MKARARLLVFTGGCLGTLLRAGAGSTPTGSFPWPTLAVNLVGTAVLGVLVGRLEAGRLSTARLHFAGVGVLGALTTFGTMAVQIIDLASTGRRGAAVAYAMVSLLAGAGVGVVALRAGEEWA